MEDHPGISQDFLEGILSKPFPSIPIDLTLEQTINVDAANSSSCMLILLKENSFLNGT